MIENAGTDKLMPRFLLKDIEINVLKNAIVKDAQECTVEPRLIRILVKLSKSHGEIVSRADLLSEISEHASVSDESLTQAMSKIRQALGDIPNNPTFIKTVPKRGYQLLVPAVPITDDTSTTVVHKKSFWPLDKSQAIIYGVLLFLLLIVLSVFFRSEENTFIEKGDIEFTEKEP